ncbi:MAG: leucine-rich repeat protein, partial [Bacilli bacterium]|nr:leucine-rich repeat protein [Bacilli bacterium]
QNTTFVAQYVVTKLFVVKWYNWNGELLVTTKVKDGDRAYYPSYEPSRPGDEQYSFYTFVGWDKDTALVKSDMEFVAVYTPGDLAKHIIEWYSEGKLIEQDQEVEYGTVLSYDGQMPTKEGSSFYGWSTDPNSVVGKKENEFKAEGPFEDGKMKLYAVFGDQDRIEITFNFGDKVPSGNIGVKFSINNKIEEEDEYVTMEWGDGNTESTKEIYDTSYPTNTSYSEPRTYVKTMYHPTTKYQSNTDYTIKIVRYGLNFKFAYFGSYSKMIENSLAPYVKKINISSDLDSTYAPIGITYGCYNLEELIIGPRVINLNNTGNNSTSNPFTTSDLKLISVSEENPIYDSRNDCNAIIETETNTLIVGTSSTTIPQNVVKIGKNAFYNRSSLTTITIPTSVLEIEEYAFYNCNSLTNINIHSGIDTIPSYCFYNCSKLSNFNFSNLKLIKQSAFYNNGFTNLILSNSKSLKTIESSAFAGCVKLTSVTIPDNVTSLGSAAFSGCSTLSTINTGDGIILLSNSMFNKCLKLSNVTLSSNLVSIGSSAFYECSSLTSITLPSKVNTIESNAFYKCSKLSTVNFSESLVSINSSAFYECSSLSTLNLSNKVKTIGYSAFYGCYNLTSANFGTTFLETIGEKAFYECYRITSVNLPNTLQNIGPNAFYGCSKITSITIPESVSFIGSSPFSMCRTLEKIIVNEGNQYFTSDINGVLYNKNQTSLIQFPPGKQVENNMYTIADTVTEIGDYAFASCVYLEIIVSPDTITSIGNYAFSGSNLARFEVSSSTETIGSYAFYGCSRLNSLIINNGVKTIGERAFENCIALSELTLPDSVTSIGQAAFMNCSYLEKLVLSNGLKTIPNNFCNECDLLNNVVIPDSVTSIGSWAFSKCNSLKNIIIGSGVTSIDSYAFYTESSVTDRKIRMKPSVAPTIASNTFTKEYFTKANNCSIIVDYSSSNAILTGYLEATNWVSYKDIITSILAYTVNEFDFGGIQKSINESNEMVLNALPNSGYKFANWYNYTPGELIIPESSLINATFDKDLLVTYPFKLNENGYYESGNKNAGATFSKARFKFNVTKENQGILIKYISNGESSWDFGIIGKIDTILPNNNSTNSSTDYVNFKGQASTEEKKVVIAGLTTGEHFIEVKYIKDSSGNSGDDSLQVKVYLGDLKTEIIYGDLYSQEPEINVGVIDITNITKEPLSLIAKFEKEV